MFSYDTKLYHYIRQQNRLFCLSYVIYLFVPIDAISYTRAPKNHVFIIIITCLQTSSSPPIHCFRWFACICCRTLLPFYFLQTFFFSEQVYSVWKPFAFFDFCSSFSRYVLEMKKMESLMLQIWYPNPDYQNK